MRFLLLLAITFSTSLVFAETEKQWICEEGDYHLSLIVAKDSKSFNYEICEFASCSVSDLAHIAIQSPPEKANSYLIVGPASAEHLILSFGSDDNLNQVERINDSYVIQTFANCKLN